MTARQMMAVLNHRTLVLPKQELITDDMRLLFLNLGAEWAAALLDRHYLHEIEVSQADISLDTTTGYYDLTSLTYQAFMPEKSLHVKITDGKFATKKSFEEYRILTNNNLLTALAYDPIYTIIGSRIYVQPFTGVTVDLIYLKQPDTIAFDTKETFAVTTGGAKTLFSCNDTSLSSVDSVYVGDVVKFIAKGSYHIVTAYTGSTHAFEVTPATADNITSADTFQILTDIIPLASPTDTPCNLTSLVHPAIIEYAAGQIAQTTGEYKLAESMEARAHGMIEQLNHIAPPTDSVKYFHDMEALNYSGDVFPLVLDFSDLST